MRTGPRSRCRVQSTLCAFEVGRRLLAGPPVCINLVGYLLAFREAAHAGPLHRADMDEHVLPAIVRLDEAVTLRLVEPLHGTRWHGCLLEIELHTLNRTPSGGPLSSIDVGENVGTRAQQSSSEAVLSSGQESIDIDGAQRLQAQVRTCRAN